MWLAYPGSLVMDYADGYVQFLQCESLCFLGPDDAGKSNQHYLEREDVWDVPESGSNVDYLRMPVAQTPDGLAPTEFLQVPSDALWLLSPSMWARIVARKETH